MDKLDQLFELQSSLNDRIFQKRALTGQDGQVLSMSRLVELAGAQAPAPGSDTATGAGVVSAVNAVTALVGPLSVPSTPAAVEVAVDSGCVLDSIGTDDISAFSVSAPPPRS